MELTTRATPNLQFFLALSAILAIAYGAFGSSLYEGAPPFVVGTIFKASSIVFLGLIALIARSRLLAAGLLFGTLGDALLAWSPDTFLYGAFAFLIGHLFYIALFLRAGLGVSALKQPPRLLAALALIAACIVMTALLVPRDNAMFAPLSVYTGVLTLMAITSFTLPAARWLAMAGALLFFISDGFVAWNMLHPDPDPTLAFWRSFAGWMIYWAGQAAIYYGALGLHRAPSAASAHA
ncbi:lysoplasmalogenase [Terricaulis silvestris]|uniref:YhhN-like protein n=1 Tax=Terricaulis silvestris TaxID=2686094 RepID=A0A6I6MRW8_9CAUL|nr:lysoplasmalogenase [Terricaulis silvestris]QGZ95547.1 YhhN-like protein [Terricaulis silvestris]